MKIIPYAPTPATRAASPCQIAMGRKHAPTCCVAQWRTCLSVCRTERECLRPIADVHLACMLQCCRIWARTRPPTAAQAPSATISSTGKQPSWGHPIHRIREAYFS